MWAGNGMKWASSGAIAQTRNFLIPEAIAGLVYRDNGIFVVDQRIRLGAGRIKTRAKLEHDCAGADDAILEIWLCLRACLRF